MKISGKLLLVLTSLSAIGCGGRDVCGTDPGLAACVPDGGVPGTIDYRSTRVNLGGGVVSDFETGDCGAFAKIVTFLIPGGATEAGCVIQKVTVSISERKDALVSSDLQMCVGGDPYNTVFWEAFCVPQGADSALVPDYWVLPPQSVSNASFSITGEAAFYTESEMIDEHPAEWFMNINNPELRGPSGDLPSTSNEPIWWKASRVSQSGVTRTLAGSWECCPAKETDITTNSHNR